MLDSTKQEQPSLMAIELCQKHLALKLECITSRADAAQLRREAKTAKLKVDALAMKSKAKELSDQAAMAKKQSERANKEFVSQAEIAHKLLVQRMPPQWNRWGVVKTRAYANLIDLITSQLQRVHVKAPLVSSALQRIAEHEAWSDRLIGQLATMKPASKYIPE